MKSKFIMHNSGRQGDPADGGTTRRQAKNFIALHLTPYTLHLILLILLTCWLSPQAYGESSTPLTQYLERLNRAQQTLKEANTASEWQSAKETVAQAFPGQEAVTFPDGQTQNLSLPFKKTLQSEKTQTPAASLDQERRELTAALELYRKELEHRGRVKAPTAEEQRKSKEQLEEILRSPEFTGYRQAPWLQQLNEWLNEILSRLFKSLGMADSKFLKYFAYGLMAVLLLLIIYFLVKSLGPLFSTRKKAKDLKPQSAKEEDFRKEDWAERARALAEAGDYRGAARACYLGILQALEQERLLRYNRSKTNWEYLAELLPRPQLYSPMRELTQSFDYIWYGHRALGAEDYQQYYQGCREVKDSVKEIKAGSRQ